LLSAALTGVTSGGFIPNQNGLFLKADNSVDGILYTHSSGKVDIPVTSGMAGVLTEERH
jgi:hypothetical protein